MRRIAEIIVIDRYGNEWGPFDGDVFAQPEEATSEAKQESLQDAP